MTAPPLAQDDDPERRRCAIISSADADEQVGRDGEDVAGLAQAAQVADRDQADRDDADDDPRSRASAGTAEVICSTADDVETATVRM